MLNILLLSEKATICGSRIIALGSYQSKPMRRLWFGAKPDRRLNLTFGRPMRTVLVLDGGFIAVTHRTVAEVSRALSETGEGNNAPPWW